MTFTQWLKAFEEKVRPLEKALTLENWLHATTGKKEHEAKLAKVRAELRKLYSDASDFKFLSDTRKNDTALDPLLKRQLQLTWSSFASYQFSHELIDKISKLESEIEGIYNNFRGQLDGCSVDNNAIRKILREDTDLNQRHKAWLAAKQIGPEVEKKVLEVVRLRNEGAKSCGFKNYYLMSLELDELDEKKLFKLLDDLEAKTRPAFLAEKKTLDQELASRFDVVAETLSPWHYADPFFQEAPPRETFKLDIYFKGQDIVALTRRTFLGMGLEIDGILEKSDLFGRPGKDQHAFCTVIGRSKDVRVLCNIEPNDYWTSTMLHEFGHGVYDWYLDEKLPYFLHSTAHTLSTEAIAMFFGRLTRNPDWLKKILGVEDTAMKKFITSSKAQERLSMLIFVRWVLVMCHFERALYDNPQQNLNALWWQLVERFQDIRLPKGEKRDDKPDWVCKLHLALAPVYYQNYLLGELVASQLNHHISSEIAQGKGLIENVKVGEFLVKHFFQAGARYRWDEHLEKATGQALKPDYFVQQYVAN